MALTLSIDQLGKPEIEQPLRSAIADCFTHYAGDWEVSIVGLLDRPAWEMRVSACAGDNSRAKIISAKDGGHKIEKVVSEIRQMAELLAQTNAGVGKS
jgi:hypothetical protein